MWKPWVTTTALSTSKTRRARCAESQVSKPAWSVKMSSAGIPRASRIRRIVPTSSYLTRLWSPDSNSFSTRPAL